jgi:hypothetical protein
VWPEGLHQPSIIHYQSTTTQLHMLGEESAAKGAQIKENNITSTAKSYMIT